MFKRFFSAALFFCCLISLFVPRQVSAQEVQAEEISDVSLVTNYENMGNPNFLFDGYRKGGEDLWNNATFTLTSEQGIGSLYLNFVVESWSYTLKNEDTGEAVTCGENHFLHDFVDVAGLFGKAPKSVTLTFQEDPPRLSELRVFTEGEPPKDVQRWNKAPEGGLDMLLFSTHGDDEQLFFAGVLPYYAGELGYEVQVAYLTRHANYGTVRPHEMLDGLWAVGVKNYPVFGDFEDYYCRSLSAAHAAFENRGIMEEDVLGYVVELLRQYKPLVVLGHDAGGEYGHGMHMLYSEMVQKAVQISMDPEKFPDSAKQWGVWDVPKTYLHLYPEGAIHMNWDIPLEKFDGMTAYEVTKEYGFPAHASQYDGFSWYMQGHSKAEDIPSMGPCDFGLYRTTVGPDEEENDFFEHLTIRAEQKRLEEEEARRQEEAKLREEEENKKKQAQLQAQKTEEGKKALEEAQRNVERKAADLRAMKLDRDGKNLILAVFVLLILVAILLTLLAKRKRRKK